MPFKFAIGVALTFLSATSLADSSTTSITAFEPCRIGTPPTTVAAECATVTVSFTHGLTPENPATDNVDIPRIITLSVARIQSRAGQAEDDPVTILAGGPGQSAMESWPQIQAAFYPVLAKRDIYLIDQRGTGSSVRLDCPTPPADLELNPDLEQVSTDAALCYESQRIPTQWFTTSVAVRDLDSVRSALGVERWNLYGVSYGTRVALHYLRRYADRTRSVILDAVVAPQKPIGPEIPLHAQHSLDALLKRCKQDSGCAEAFPDLHNKTRALFQSLRDNPRTVQYENISLGALSSMEFNDQHLAATVRLLSYSSYGTAILPSMLFDAAVNNNLAPFARQAAMQISQLDGAIATGMHAAVICTEDAPYIDSMANRGELENTYLGDFIVDAMVASCRQWPMGVIDDDFHKPVDSDIPVLALSGGVDPITPPDYAALAIELLSNATHIVNPHQGHTQAPLGCMPSIMFQFIDNADPKALNVECLERLSPPALFVDANGPLP